MDVYDVKQWLLGNLICYLLICLYSNIKCLMFTFNVCFAIMLFSMYTKNYQTFVIKKKGFVLYRVFLNRMRMVIKTHTMRDNGQFRNCQS